MVSRRPSGSPNFKDDGNNDSTLPELRSVVCDDSSVSATSPPTTAKTLTIRTSDFGLVPNGGYIVDSVTGTAYIIISRNDNNDTVTLLTEPPLDSDISSGRDFWVIPGPESGGNYGPKSPAIRVFQAMLYLP
ncbi:hypothetical protein ES705_49577 [subsurface metagenome]